MIKIREKFPRTTTNQQLAKLNTKKKNIRKYVISIRIIRNLIEKRRRWENTKETQSEGIKNLRRLNVASKNSKFGEINLRKIKKIKGLREIVRGMVRGEI